YQELMKESSRMPLFDLRKLNASLPVPSAPNLPLEVFVLGANNDFIVDAEGLKETAEFYGVSPVCVEGVAHDMMLDTSWDKG
ncbi:ATP-dependent DNA helicase Q4, partial [Trifolium medium]|nr:ATP-dependent DNA helicase Q4 [Trifolium medium]